MINQDHTESKAEMRILTEVDTEAYWKLRLRALKEEPQSFGGSYEEAVKIPLAEITPKLKSSQDSFIVGAFCPYLVGLVGCYRRSGLKLQHKGNIWGMYVAPEFRGKGLGKALMEKLIAHASTLPHLESLLLSVVTTNKVAQDLYLSLGFTTYGIERKILKIADRYFDEELMTRDLI